MMTCEREGNNYPVDDDRRVEALWVAIDGHGALLQTRRVALKDVNRKLDELMRRLDFLDLNANKNEYDNRENARDCLRLGY